MKYTAHSRQAGVHDQQTGRQAGRQAGRHTQAGTHTGRHSDRHTDTQTIHRERHRDKSRHRQIQTNTETQTNRDRLLQHPTYSCHLMYTQVMYSQSISYLLLTVLQVAALLCGRQQGV